MKVTYTNFPLSTQAGRIGLLLGISAGTVPKVEVDAAVLRDTEKRPNLKPVVVLIKRKEQRFPSVRSAAKALISGMWFATPHEYALALNAKEKEIAHACNADNVVGYYWSA